MTDRKPISAEEAPELHNAEQDDEAAQAQTVAREAFTDDDEASPLDSRKLNRDDDEEGQDLVDKMRDMEQSGRIDMGAYRGEPNFDDEDDAYGEGHDDDDEDDDDE